MKTALKWVAGVFCFIGSFSALSQGVAGSFVLLLLAALVTTPPTLHLIETWLGIKFQRPYKYLLSGGLFVLGAVNMPEQPEEKQEPVPITTNADSTSRANEIPVEETKPCNCQVTPLYQRDIQYWFSVKDFDVQNKECFQSLRNYAHSFALDKAGTIHLHFFDNLPDFKPPSDGRSNYGGEKIMEQEILLYQRLGAKEFFFFDNWNTGKYTEKAGFPENRSADSANLVLPIPDTTIPKAPSKRKKRRSETTSSNQVAPVEYYSNPSPEPTKRTVRKSVSGGNGYVRGPRGGCYYYSSSGKKVYVDRSYCD